jgi:hypothetical protein
MYGWKGQNINPGNKKREKTKMMIDALIVIISLHR